MGSQSLILSMFGIIIAADKIANIKRNMVSGHRCPGIFYGLTRVIDVLEIDKYGFDTFVTF
jgi:hypothetical protein